MEIKVIGELTHPPWDKRYHLIRSVYGTNGICPTLTAGMGMGGGTEVKVIICK